MNVCVLESIKVQTSRFPSTAKLSDSSNVAHIRPGNKAVNAMRRLRAVHRGPRLAVSSHRCTGSVADPPHIWDCKIPPQQGSADAASRAWGPV